MRLPNSTFPFAFSVPLLLIRCDFTVMLFLAVFTLYPSSTNAQNTFPPQVGNGRMYDSSLWDSIELRLPDRLTATPEALEQQGDILRARRFPEDAIDYYNFALQNGGDHAMLMDKLGLSALAMKDVPWAQAYFKRVVQIDRKSADGWNNLGTVEYLNGRTAFAIADYERAVKLDKGRAVFHCNLAMVYFGRGDVRSARKEIAAALKLDPMAFEHESDSPGVTAHLLSSADRARLSFELAKLYARSGEEEQMLHSLARSSEAGLDIRHEMRRDRALAVYVSDPRVAVLMHNAEALRAGPGDAGYAAGAVRGGPVLAAMVPLE
jgi:tetratricopeptide (TPR) repeat protein